MRSAKTDRHLVSNRDGEGNDGNNILHHNVLHTDIKCLESGCLLSAISLSEEKNCSFDQDVFVEMTSSKFVRLLLLLSYATKN